MPLNCWSLGAEAQPPGVRPDFLEDEGIYCENAILRSFINHAALEFNSPHGVK